MKYGPYPSSRNEVTPYPRYSPRTPHARTISLNTAIVPRGWRDCCCRILMSSVGVVTTLSGVSGGLSVGAQGGRAEQGHARSDESAACTCEANLPERRRVMCFGVVFNVQNLHEEAVRRKDNAVHLWRAGENLNSTVPSQPTRAIPA